MELLKPNKFLAGDTIGIFTPSSPAYKANEELFLNGIKNIEMMGFKVKLGFLTSVRASQGYRSASPKDRAREFMELIADDNINALVSTIGEEQAEADITLFLANVEKEIHESIPLLGASEELELFSLFGIHQGMISYSITQLRKNAMPVIPLEKKLPKIILTSKLEPNKSINLAKNHNEDILRVNSPKVIKDLVINQSTFGKGSHVGICLVKFSVKHIAAMDIYASYLSLYFLPNEIRDKCGAYTVGARIIYDQKYFSITISRLLDPKAAYDKILSELFILPNISNVVFEKAKLLSIGSFDYPMDLREAAKWSWGLNVSGWHINEISTYKETIINMSLNQLYHLVNDVSELGDQVRLLVKV